MKSFFISLCILTGGMLAAQSITPQIIQSGAPLCSVGDCTTYALEYTPLHSTTSYEVESLAFSSPYTIGAGTVVDYSGDDQWSQQIILPFPFCFYGTGYLSLLIGSNGLVTFDNSFLGEACPFNFSDTIPSPGFPVKNAIYGVYQDTDIAGEAPGNYYVTHATYGQAPNRVFVINFNQLPAYGCPDQPQTSQIILHELTNNIDVYVQNRSSCANTINPNALLGIQNTNGTLALTPTGRNTGNWEASNEAWRFSPSGASITTVYWYLNSVPIAIGSDSVSVCPEESMSQIWATLSYNGCAGSSFNTFSTINFGVDPGQPDDLYACSADGIGNFNLTQNNIQIVNGQDISNYEIGYFMTQADAENYVNPIAEPTVYISESSVIYYRIESLSGGCWGIGNFAITVNSFPGAPIGTTTQNFNSGQTLADLDVTGIAIQWFADSAATIPLPETTLLEDGVTYYALETYVPPGCVDFTGRAALDVNNVLAVTVNLVLSTSEYDYAAVKIYPNPASGMVNVSADGTMELISIYSIQGRLLLETRPNANSAVVDLTGLASGTYLLKVSGQDGTQVAKVVKR